MGTEEFRAAMPASFLSLGEGALAEMERGSEERIFAPGANIFQTGEESDGLYIIYKGSVEVSMRITTPEGWRLVPLASMPAGDVLGEMSLFDDQQRHADANAGKDGAVLRFFPVATLRRIQHLYPHDYIAGLRKLVAVIVRRLDATNQRLVQRLAAERSEGITRDLVVHDLRSPLAVIDTGVQALLQRPEIYGAVNRKQSNVLERIGKTVAFLRLLVDSILEVERARQGQTRERQSSLAEILQACAAPLLSMIAPERWMYEHAGSEGAFEEMLRGTRLVLPSHEALLIPLRADPLRLAQVLMNLIGNAIRYTTGQVELSVERKANAIQIDITDHGSGIPLEKRELIFAPFKEQDLSGGRLPVGKGFGLAGVREMVVSMGAALSVHDRADGQVGASFRLLLPASAA